MSIPDFREYYYLDDITKKSLGFLESFDELEAVAIMLGFKPSFGIELFQNEYDWFVAPVKQLRKDVENGRLTKSTYTTEQGYGFNDVYVYQVNSLDMKEWASFYGYDWKIPEYKPFKPQQNEFLKSDETLLQNTTNQDQIAELQARIAELEAEKQNTKKPEPQSTTENKTQRISQPQRDIFTLLVIKSYPNCQSRNRLFEAINADLRANGITTKDIKYSTLDKLIDENIRTGSPIRSPFPPKQS